jgi:hypothetical protein
LDEKRKDIAADLPFIYDKQKLAWLIRHGPGRSKQILKLALACMPKAGKTAHVTGVGKRAQGQR